MAHRRFRNAKSTPRAAIAIGIGLGALAIAGGIFFTLATEDGDGERTKLEARLEFEKRFRSGLELSRTFQLERALHEFEACLRVDRDHALARFQRGRVLLAVGRRAEGLADLEAALARDPTNSRIRRFLFDLHSMREYEDEAKSHEHYLHLKRESKGLIDLDLQVHRAMYEGGVLAPYAAVAERLRGRRNELDPGLQELYDAFFPGGNEDPGVQGVVGFAAFRRIFERCPGLATLRQMVALELINPSRLGLPEPDDDTIPGSKVPLSLAEMMLEDVFDHTVLLSAESMDLFSFLAMLQMKMGDYIEAAARFRLILERVDSSTTFAEQAKFQLAICQYKLGRAEEAARLFGELSSTSSYGHFAAWFLHVLGKRPLALRREALPDRVSKHLGFREAASELGVAKEDGGGCSAWGDYDGDGDLDLYVSGCDTFSALYRWDGERFTDVSLEARLTSVNSGFSNLFVDYDEDGDLDLFIARDGWAGPGQNSLLENRDGVFFDVTEAAGLLAETPGSSFTSSWSDFDRDGDLDLFVANGICGDGSTCRLWQNGGDGTFTNATRKAGLLESGTRTIGCAVGDYDVDGWPDIFLSGVEPTPNRLYRNRGDGTFEEVARKAGVDDSANVSMGFVAFIDDLNGDTLPDILMTKWEEQFARVMAASMQDGQRRPEFSRTSPRLFVNQGDGTFRDASEPAGFLYPHGTMGAGLADLNNDGSLDVYFGNGGPALERLEPDSFYVNLGKGRFVEAGRRFGLGHLGKGHGVSFADFDRDGDLDVYLPVGGAFHGDLWKNAFYVNTAGNRFHWLQIALEGTKSNRMAIGARLLLEAGGLTQQREKKCGVGFGSGDSPYVHFGLGRSTEVASLTVYWPSGTSETFENIPADRFIRIVEGRGTVEEEKEAP